MRKSQFGIVLSLFVHAVYLPVVFSGAVSVNCSSTTSGKWEEYVCELPPLQQGCEPKYTLTNASQAKGIVAVFHGYTACPDSFDPEAESWLAAGFHVIQFLTVGHGRARGDSACGDPASKCVNGDRVEGLPVGRQGYIDFVAMANAVVLEEKERRAVTSTIAVGLSLGGPLATHAASTGGGLYTHLLVMNPFYGISASFLDNLVLDCGEDLPACAGNVSAAVVERIAPNSTHTDSISSYLSWALQRHVDAEGVVNTYAELMGAVRWGLGVVAEHSDRLPSSLRSKLDEASFGWGDGCEAERANGRAGICSFLLRNLLAVHSFGQYVMQQTGTQGAARPAHVQFVMVERDGPARNSLAMHAAANYKRKLPQGIGACMFQLVPVCAAAGNECGVPHSMVSRAEQVIPPPHVLYWEDHLLSQSVSFLDTGRAMGVPSSTTTIAREDCRQISVDAPPPSLVLPYPRSVWLTVKNAVVEDLPRRAQVLLAAALANATVLDPSLVVVPLEVIKGATNSQILFEVPGSLTSDQLQSLERVVDDGLGDIKSSDIVSLEVAGREPVNPSSGASQQLPALATLVGLSAYWCLFLSVFGVSPI